MTKIEKIKGDIQALSPDEQTALKRWLDEADAQIFDDKIEADAASGKLDSMIAKARANYRAERQPQSRP